jgi:membrane protein DedA with SNARE-associated domain
VRELFREIARLVIGAVTAHAYLTLFVIIAMEEAGVPIPVPGDLVIAYYGWRAAGDPFEIARTILTCAAASMVGTQLPYWLARRFGARVVDKVAFWLDLDKTKIATLLTWIERHGFWAVLAARVIPGFRAAVSVVAGTAHVPAPAFAGAVFISGAIYWTLWVLIGAALGPHVADALSPAYRGIVVVAIPLVFIGLFVGRYVWARRRRARPAGSATTSTGAPRDR